MSTFVAVKICQYHGELTEEQVKRAYNRVTCIQCRRRNNAVYRERNTKKIAKTQSLQWKKDTETLSDRYIKHIIRITTGKIAKHVTKTEIIAKRKELREFRGIK